ENTRRAVQGGGGAGGAQFHHPIIKNIKPLHVFEEAPLLLEKMELLAVDGDKILFFYPIDKKT
ncbi:MAG: hypothetical protein II755_12420, partial [Prevotella sp.]|nr:hypothetical protein [Prevotella sp.]